MNDNESKSKPSDPHDGPTSADTASEPEMKQGSYSSNLDDLHDLFAAAPTGDSDDEDPLAQLRNDPNYAALIRDLEYIATQARLLFTPAEEAPSDEVWNKIQTQLSSETRKS